MRGPQWEGTYVVLGQAYTFSSPILKSPTVFYKNHQNNLTLEQEHTIWGDKNAHSTEVKLFMLSHLIAEHRIAKFTHYVVSPVAREMSQLMLNAE